MPLSYNPLKATKIICLLRNYAKHAAELKNPLPNNVVFFLKPQSAILVYSPNERRNIENPPYCNIDHEVELAAVIGKEGRDIPQEDAMQHVRGYTIALDITARNLQHNAKTNGHPWTESKGFDTFLPISPELLPRDELDLKTAKLFLTVNGEVRQRASTSEMIYSVPEIIAAVSKVMTLKEHDIILTGTPHGVGRLLPGDVVRAGVENTPLQMEFGVVQREESV